MPGDPADTPHASDTFEEVARSLAKEHGVEPTLQRIVDLAVARIPGAQHAGISEVRARKAVSTVAASDELPKRVDAVQYETGQGPCLDAIFEQDVVRIDDLSDTDRWPEFAQRAADLGVLSMLSFRLFADEVTAGALNLYNGARKAFGDDAVRLGHAFAAHAALAWEHEKKVSGLRSAVETRTLIGQAQGILMASEKITPDQAFDRLRVASQKHNVKLREIAGQVVTTGQLRG